MGAGEAMAFTETNGQMTTNSTSTQGGIGEVERTGQGSSSFYFKAIFSLQLEDEFGQKK